jgi:hypothetical protein
MASGLLGEPLIRRCPDLARANIQAVMVDEGPMPPGKEPAATVVVVMGPACENDQCDARPLNLEPLELVGDLEKVMETVVAWFGKWKLLSWRTALLAAVVVYGLVGFLVVPSVVKNVVVDLARERTGREVSIDEVRCNPFTLSLTVRGFSMPDRDGTPLLAFDEFYANAELSSVFRWAATLKELRVQNPYLGLRRFDDGAINIVELMDDIEARTPPDEEPADEGGWPRAILQHILVQGSTIVVEDFARDEPLTMTFGPSKYELYGISTIPQKRGENEFAIGLQEGGTIGVDGEVVVDPLGFEGTVTIDEILLGRSWPLLKPYFQFDLVGGSAGGRFDYAVEVHDDGLHVRISDLDYRIDDLEVTLRDSDTNLLEVSSVTITDLSGVWPEGEVGAASIDVEGAEAFIWLEADGTPSWAELVPQETQTQVVRTYREVEEAFPWKFEIQHFGINGSSVRFEDRTFDEPLEFVVEEAMLELNDVVTGPGHQWGLSASAVLPGDANALAKGFVGTGPMRLETDVEVTGLDLGQLQPYIERFAPLDLRAGVLETKGRAGLNPGDDGPLASFAGELTIVEIDLRETVVGSKVLQWGRVETRGINAAVAPLGLDVESIDIHGAGIDIVVSEDGRVNLLELFQTMAERSSENGGGESSEMPPLQVWSIALHGCSGAYFDRTLAPPFTLALENVNGTVKGISSTATAGAALDVTGAVASGGQLTLDGEMDLLDPKRLTDLSIDIRQTDLPPVSPMAVRYVGHPIEQGSVDLGLRYEVTNSDLVGNNRIVTEGLALGDKVEGEGMLGLPIKLGVSLLTDKEGRITLEFPIEGNVDDPGFGLGNAIGSATKEVMGEIMKSPFRLLGKLGGGSEDEDFGRVDFEAGSAELEAAAAEKLRTLAAGADQRPEIVLQVEGVYDPEADSAALQEAAFEALLAERRDASSGDETSASLELLESLYAEAVVGGDLEALRAEHTTSADDTTAAVVDETTFYRALRAALVAAQPVDPTELQDLGAARSEAVRSLLVDEAGVDPSRVQILPTAAVEPTGDGWVSCRLDVASSS